MHTIDQESFFVDSYLDILDDAICLMTRFRFETKDMASLFIQRAALICDPVIYKENKRFVNDINMYRPRYSDIKDALKDAEDFSINGFSEDYRYRSDVLEYELETMEQVCMRIEISNLKQKIHELENENKELKLLIGK